MAYTPAFFYQITNKGVVKMRVIKYSDKIPRVSVSQFEEVDKEDACLYCLSDTTVYISSLLLEFFLEWRTIYGERLSNTLFYVSDDFKYLQSYIERGINEMSSPCNFDGVSDSIRYLADKVATAMFNKGDSGSCCNVSITVGSTLDSGGNQIPLFGTEPALSVEVGGYPAGYDNLAQYKLNKCALATAMVDNWVDVLNFLSGLNMANLSALALLIGNSLAEVVTVLVFPPAAIPVMIGLLIALGVSMAVLTSLSGYISSNRSDVICLLYKADSAEQAIAAVTDFVRNAIQELEILPGIGQIVEVIAMTLLNTDTVNKLFIKQGTENLPEGNCSDCDEQYNLYWVIGSGDLTVDGSERTWTSETFSNNTNYCRVGNEECQNIGLTVVSYSGQGNLVWDVPFKDCTSGNKTQGVVQLGIEYPYGSCEGETGLYTSMSNGLSTGFTVVVKLRSLV